jgi:hypothetical protein
MKVEPTIDCYVLVIGASDSSVNLKKSLFYIRKLFKYNSLTDKTFFHQNQNMESNSFEVQIPEFAIQYLDKRTMNYIVKNARSLIETKKRFISYRPIDNTWYINSEALYANSL